MKRGFAPGSRLAWQADQKRKEAESGRGSGRGIPADLQSPLALGSEICFYKKALSMASESGEMCQLWNDLRRLGSRASRALKI
jgi:hypothetical protein